VELWEIMDFDAQQEMQFELRHRSANQRLLDFVVRSLEDNHIDNVFQGTEEPLITYNLIQKSPEFLDPRFWKVSELQLLLWNNYTSQDHKLRLWF